MFPDLKKLYEARQKRAERRAMQKYNSRKQRRQREIRQYRITLIARAIHLVSEKEKPSQLCFDPKFYF